MRLGVISDLHLGDSSSTLVKGDAAGGYEIGKGYASLKQAILRGGPLRYLALVGDVFDFSIGTWGSAYEAAKPFLRAIKADGLAEEIIYLPGNHDFSAWTLTMQETNVLRQIASGQPPKEDRWSVPAVLDSRAGPAELVLCGVKRDPSTGLYGGLFFDHLGGIPFNVAYPNLYVVEPSGVTTLVTHGQYFDKYWCLTSTLASQMFDEELAFVPVARHYTMEELVGINYPLNDLASSGIGQAGPLTPIFRSIQQSAKRSDLQRIRHYVRRLEEVLDGAITFDGRTRRIKEWLTDAILYFVRNELLSSLQGTFLRPQSAARYNTRYFDDPATRANIECYFAACLAECRSIKGASAAEIPTPSRVLFGHTHVPILCARPGEQPEQSHRILGTKVEFWNTGGWLAEPQQMCRPALFLYDDGAPVSPWSSYLLPCG